MNLIKNTLIFVLCMQLLGFLYFKFLHNSKGNAPSRRVSLAQNIPLPQSNAYTLYQNEIPTAEKITPKKTIKKASPVKIEKRQIAIKKPKLKLASIKTTKNLLLKNLPLKKSLLKKPPLKKHISSKKKSNKKTLLVKTYHKTQKESLNSRVKKYAKELLGRKYVWGATGPKTFDCSGFTQRVFSKTLGIHIPRISRFQAKVGKYVQFNKLKTGDMVFFDTEKKYTKRVNHVGIYIGNQKFIHASSAKKKVIITSFKKKPFYKKRFLWGRRVIKESKSIATLLQQRKEKS